MDDELFGFEPIVIDGVVIGEQMYMKFPEMVIKEAA